MRPRRPLASARDRWGAVTGNGKARSGDRFGHRQAQGLGVEIPGSLQAGEQPVSLLRQAPRVRSWRNEPRGVRQHRQGRRLAPGQLPGLLAEVPAGGRPVADDVAAVRRVVEVETKDLLLGGVELDPERQQGFQGLVEQGAGLGAHQPRHLHGEGAGAAATCPAATFWYRARPSASGSTPGCP